MRLPLPIPYPGKGTHLFSNPRAIPPEGAAELLNLRADDGLVQLREGCVPLLTAPNTTRIADLSTIEFNDGVVRTMRHTNSTGTSGASSPLHYDDGSGTWNANTLDNALWTSAQSGRIWMAVVPWASSARGRLVISNNIKIKQWDGNSATAPNFSDVVGGYPSKYAIVGDDRRLILANTFETPDQLQQRVRWTQILLPNGNATDWSGPGSGSHDLRQDQYPITGLFKLVGSIFVGKTRALARLEPTGDSLDAYSSQTIVTGGRGIFIPASLAQYDNYVVMMAHDEIVVFDGINATPVGAPVSRALYKRITRNATNYITAIVDGENRRVGWMLPLDGSEKPTEIWWLSLDGHWETDQITSLGACCGGIYSGVDVLTYAELATAAGTYAGIPIAYSTYGDMQPYALPRPSLMWGGPTGQTWRTDASTFTDFGGTSLQGRYTSPAFPVVGQQIADSRGGSHTITDSDELVVDEVRFRMASFGTAYTAIASISRDNGMSWTSIGGLAVPAGGSLTSPRIYECSAHCRLSVEDFVMVRLEGPATGTKWGFTDGTVYIQVLGRKQR